MLFENDFVKIYSDKHCASLRAAPSTLAVALAALALTRKNHFNLKMSRISKVNCQAALPPKLFRVRCQADLKLVLPSRIELEWRV